MNLCIGIDPSLNSSGLCELFVDDEGNIVKEMFFIIKADHLTKRELAAQEKYSELLEENKLLKQELYDLKEELSIAKMNINDLQEDMRWMYRKM